MLDNIKKIIYFFNIAYYLQLISPKFFLKIKTFFLLLKQPEASKLFSLMKKEKFDFIDIGAFHGVYTNLAMRSKNCRKSILVEANYTNYLFLKKVFNSRDIDIKNNIFSLNSGELSFFVPILHNSQYGKLENGLGSGISGRFKNESEIKVKSINLAQLISCLNIKCRSLILKVDIEGMEGDFIENLHLISFDYNRIILLIEITNINFHKYLAELEGLGFNLFFSGKKYTTQDHIFIKDISS